MLRLGLAIFLIATAARAAALDTAKLDQARSVIAEAALLARAEAGGRVTRGYADGLRDSLKEDLTDLAKDPAFAAVAHQALAALARGDEAALAALRDRLVQLERSHGRAG